jgi:hypothetical protein
MLPERKEGGDTIASTVPPSALIPDMADHADRKTCPDAAVA